MANIIRVNALLSLIGRAPEERRSLGRCYYYFEMKRHSVIASKKATHNNLEIARFLKVVTSFVRKVRKENTSDYNIPTNMNSNLCHY
ncbi:hypothetical protein ACTXT7_014284 [Hymenolepis weldensis]